MLLMAVISLVLLLLAAIGSSWWWRGVNNPVWPLYALFYWGVFFLALCLEWSLIVKAV